MTLEEMRVVDALVVEMFGKNGLTADECEDVCEVCPFAERCGREELYWGCGVWEEMMGEDLQKRAERLFFKKLKKIKKTY